MDDLTSTQSETMHWPKCSCEIEEIPENGYVEAAHSDYHLSLNYIIRHTDSVYYYCNKNYVMVGESVRKCISGEWMNGVPKCKPPCDTRKLFSITFEPRCTIGRRPVKCAKQVPLGTVARITCKWGYEYVRSEEVVTCGDDGQWTAVPTQCQPICGEGFLEERQIVPWQVYIYKRIGAEFERICLGTILNAKIVISAISCFWDRANGRPFDVGQYKAKVGERYQTYDSDSKEYTKVQTFSIEEFFYPETYDDVVNDYADNIALLLLDQYIEFNEFIAPICINYDMKMSDFEPPNNGFSKFTEKIPPEYRGNGKYSAHSEIVDSVVCENGTMDCSSEPETDERYVGICSEDVGGSLTGALTIDGRWKHVLFGVTNVGPSNENGGCDPTRTSRMTFILNFVDFIAYYDMQYRVIFTYADDGAKPTALEASSCRITEIPQNGSVSPVRSFKKKLKLGDRIVNDETVLFKCNNNFDLNGNSGSSCLNGKWTQPTPKCISSTPEKGEKLILYYIYANFRKI